MYFAAKHKDVKLAQDFADCTEDESTKALILCDGIGEFAQSGQTARLVVEMFIENVLKDNFSIQHFTKQAQLEIEKSGIIGGTTMICAIQNKGGNLNLHYLGNGGIIHLYGDFKSNPYSEFPYRYVELMNPHVTPEGALYKHISHNSGKNELSPDTVSLNLSSENGDIFLFFTDGIGSLEEKAIIKTEDGIYWRHENENIQSILNRLHEFLLKDADNFSVDGLIGFVDETLDLLKEEKRLEDDASLGIIITESTINRYKSVE